MNEIGHRQPGFLGADREAVGSGEIGHMAVGVDGEVAEELAVGRIKGGGPSEQPVEQVNQLREAKM